jgi:hypothetical protein
VLGLVVGQSTRVRIPRRVDCPHFALFPTWRFSAVLLGNSSELPRAPCACVRAQRLRATAAPVCVTVSCVRSSRLASLSLALARCPLSAWVLDCLCCCSFSAWHCSAVRGNVTRHNGAPKRGVVAQFPPALDAQKALVCHGAAPAASSSWLFSLLSFHLDLALPLLRLRLCLRSPLALGLALLLLPQGLSLVV